MAKDDDNDQGYSSGSAYIFSLEEDGTVTGTWEQSAKLVALDGYAGDFFGQSVAVSPGLVAVGAPYHDEGGFYAGAVYVYTPDSLGSWTQANKLQAGGTSAIFGSSVAMSGGTVVVGAGCSRCSDVVGSVYVFSCTATGECTETDVLRAEDGAAGDYFGTSVAMSCNRVVVGAHQDDDQGQSSGSVYTFTRQPAGEWVQTHKIVPTDGARIDFFGYQVAVSSHTVAAGAPRNFLGSAYVRDVCDS